jgi:hypothetical protein
MLMPPTPDRGGVSPTKNHPQHIQCDATATRNVSFPTRRGRISPRGGTSLPL